MESVGKYLTNEEFKFYYHRSTPETLSRRPGQSIEDYVKCIRRAADEESKKKKKKKSAA